MTNAPDVPAPAEDEVRYYSTPSMTVEWHASRCQHSGRCVRALPRVFSPARRPWIQLGDFAVDVVEAAVAQCPSGALQFIRHDDESRANRAESEA